MAHSDKTGRPGKAKPKPIIINAIALGGIPPVGQPTSRSVLHCAPRTFLLAKAFGVLGLSALLLGARFDVKQLGTVRRQVQVQALIVELCSRALVLLGR